MSAIQNVINNIIETVQNLESANCYTSGSEYNYCNFMTSNWSGRIAMSKIIFVILEVLKKYKVMKFIGLYVVLC